MRILDQAIEEKLYEESDVILRLQCWSDFETISDRFPVYLFGSGEGADYVLQRYGKNLNIVGIFDNDRKKWGKKLTEYITYPFEEELRISSPNILKEIASDCIVLITSVRYCDEIFSQLRQMKIHHIYSLLHMEANRRRTDGESIVNSVENEQIAYAKECLKLPVIDNKIILARDGLAGHGKQIFLRLIEAQSNYDLVWVTEKNDNESIPGVRIILHTEWKTYIEELETAKIWIFGDMIPEFAIKRTEQIYIHVKHWASITLKSFYFHLKKHLEIKSIYTYYRHNTDAMDYCMVGSDFDEDTCRSGFDFDGEFVRVGSPRSDVLFQKGIKDRVYEKLGLRTEDKTVLYAPTFRSRNKNTLIGCMRDVDLDFCGLKEALEKKFGGEWFILLRIHPDVAMESRRIKKKSFVYDVSQYSDSEELVAASDVVISDYSSIMFEPAFVNKPVFLYAPDADEYINHDRELLLDYYSLPFSISKSNDELEKAIYHYDENKYRKDVESFLNKYGVHEDGCASKRAADYIIALLDGSNK